MKLVMYKIFQKGFWLVYKGVSWSFNLFFTFEFINYSISDSKTLILKTYKVLFVKD